MERVTCKNIDTCELLYKEERPTLSKMGRSIAWINELLVAGGAAASGATARSGGAGGCAGGAG